MSGISLLLVIIIGAGAIRLVTKPLSQLERVASQITVNLEQIENQEGSALFDSSIDTLKTIRSHDEIGLLATAFLRLTQKLHSALDSLQIAAKNWQLTFNSVHEALVTLDTEGRIVTMNRIAEDWFRVSLTKVHGQNAASVLFDSQEPPKDWPDVALLMQHQKVIWSQEIGRSEGIFQFTITPITTEKKTIGAVLTVNDITELVETEEQVRNMAFYDQLTGLPNRFLLKDRILQALIMAGRAQQRVALMFLDLDHFKRANDRYGHDVGDTLLCQVANTLSRCIRGNDTLSRIGGDEFVIVLHETDSQQINPTIVADRIITALSNPFFINGHELRVGTSIGIAYFPEDGEDDTTLLKHADMAMYQAKSYGGNTYRFFQS
jgi:diguanylate cyclase (GGDEF)-like protein/PAS domain S-box-containing protein